MTKVMSDIGSMSRAGRLTAWKKQRLRSRKEHSIGGTTRNSLFPVKKQGHSVAGEARSFRASFAILRLEFYSKYNEKPLNFKNNNS